MSTQPEEKKEIVEPTIALYIHLFTDKEKGIILTVKGNLNSKVIRILDLKQYMSLQFKQSISNVKYTPLELYKSLYSKPLKDTDKIRTYFDDGEDIYLQVLTEAIPVETTKTEKKDVVLHGFEGTITNIKVFDVYNDSISEILQMFPNHQHLIINDTARKVLDMHGVSMQ